MIASTWEAHCAQYTPGQWGRDAVQVDVDEQADVLQRILAAALTRNWGSRSIEETSMGHCWEAA